MKAVFCLLSCEYTGLDGVRFLFYVFFVSKKGICYNKKNNLDGGMVSEAKEINSHCHRIELDFIFLRLFFDFPETGQGTYGKNHK